METIQTFKGDDKSATCLICNTTFFNGPPIYPQPSCACGNISFFDITPYYVRFGINWSFIKHNSSHNWQKRILEQIEQFGKPKHIANDPEGDREIMNFK